MEELARLKRDMEELKARDSFMTKLSECATVIGLPVALAGLFAGAQFAVYLKYPSARPVKNLWTAHLRHFVRDLHSPIVKFSLDPYSKIDHARALIVQGRNKEGKTTLFATCIPWWRRYGPFAHKGILFNGRAGKGVDSFEKWQTSQLFGQTTRGGAELQVTLEDFRNRQWVRGLLSDFLPFVHPAPAIVIVDQCEELLKRFPDEGLGWCDQLADLQCRENMTRIFFVVNSSAGAKSLLNLNRGRRFDLAELEPLNHDEALHVPGLEVARFEACASNIGLYKDTVNVPADELDAEVSYTLRKWEDDFHIPYSVKYDPSWAGVDETEFDATLLRALRARLETTNKYTEEKINDRIAWTAAAIEGDTPPVLRDMTAKEWKDQLIYTRAERFGCLSPETLASEIKHTLSVPVPAAALVEKEERNS
jgi:hypothetical protein